MNMSAQSQSGSGGRKQGYLICYHPDDRAWAVYIDAKMQEFGHPTQLDVWDVEPGTNFVLAWEQGLARLGAALLVVSRSFAADPRPQVWTAALAQGKVVVPVVVDDCAVPGALAAHEAIDLRGLPEHEWVQQLRERLAPQRPAVSPPFPGARAGTDRPSGPRPVSRPGAWRYLLDRCAPRLHGLLVRLGVMSEPEEAADLRNHLARLRAALLQELRERAYVPLDAGLVPAAPSTPGPADDPFVRPVHRLIRQVLGSARGGDGATAQISAVSRRSRIVRDIAHALLHSDEPLVLLGDPGSGKTMTLQHAVLAVIDQQLRRVFPVVPVFVRLGDFHARGGLPDEADVLAHVLRALDPAIASRLQGLHEAGRLIVFFDGMDEMSRERYGAHVEALSRFASSRHPLTRSLFSCRINDFSPEFIHRRLVLLPFERRQVREYLQLYVPQWPLRISGRNYSLRALTERLWSGDAVVDARNPFVLWLLRYYLLAKQEWPQSRPGLLAFYCRRTWEKKRAEAPGEAAFRQLRRPFAALGRLALTLMERNLGSSATLAELEPAFGSGELEALVTVGVRCGVLVGTAGPGPRRVRFAHHRLQEFFAARAIRRSPAPIDWMAAVDAPRWQETLVNYVLMGGPLAPVEQLRSSIDERLDAATARLEERKQPGRRTGASIWKDDDEETAVADRVELLSRLIRQGGGSLDAPVQTFGRAVALLGEHGNPSTQVKMLWASENVPQAEVGTTLNRLLESRIGWVRNQALMLLAGGRARLGGGGSDLATQIGFAIARGELPLRVVGHAKAAAAAGGVRPWCHLAWGLVCFGLLLAGFAALAGGMYLLARWLPQGAAMADLLTPARFAAVLAVMALLALMLAPGALWLAILFTGLAAPVLAASAGWMWSAPMGEFVGTVMASLIGGFAAGVALAVPALLLHGLALAAFAIGALPVAAGVRTWRRTLAVASDASGYGEAWELLKTAVPTLAVIGLAIAAIGLVARLLEPFGRRVQALWRSLGEASGLPLDAATSAALIFFAFSLAILFLAYRVQSRREKRGVARTVDAVMVVLAGVLAYLGGMIFAINLFGDLAVWLAPLVAWFERLGVGSFVVRTVLVVVSLGLLIWLGWMLWTATRRMLALLAFWRRPFAARSLTPAQWRALLAQADAVGQDQILQRSSQQAVGLDAQSFLALLREQQALVREDPALGTYWRMRHELEQVLRQEQQGRIGAP